MDELDTGALLDELLAERFPPIPRSERARTGSIDQSTRRQRERATLDAANAAVSGRKPLP